jgi:hypothetical protein
MFTRLLSWLKGNRARAPEALAYPRPPEHLFRTVDTAGPSPIPTAALVESQSDIVITHDDAELEAWSQAFDSVTVEHKN